VINLNAQVVNMVNVLCLGCVLVILVGLVQTAPFVKSDLIVNTADVLMSRLNANVTANTMDQLVMNQCVLRDAIQNMAIAMYLNNVGANLAGLVKTALFVNPTGVVFMELAMTIPGSAFVRKDGWDPTAIAQKILMATGVSGVNGVPVLHLVVLAKESEFGHATTQPQLEMERTAPMTEVHVMNLKNVMMVTALLMPIQPVVPF